MELLALLFIALFCVGLMSRRKEKRSGFSSGGPMIMRSNGYEGHLDFLEMHGCITAEERESHREAIAHYKAHPEQYVTMTLEELLEESKIT